MGTKLNGTTVGYRRNLVLDHIKTYMREEMSDNLIKLGKETARNKDLRTLYLLAQKMRS